MRGAPEGWEAIYAMVRRIPRGRVATYGEIAARLGRPRAARQVGFAMAALRGSRHDVPWHRVLGARPRGQAAVSILDPMGAAVQRAKLEKEGIRFDARQRIDLARFGWGRARRIRSRATAVGRGSGAAAGRPRAAGARARAP